MMSIYHEDNPTVAPHLAIANAAADEWMQHTPRASGADMDKVRCHHALPMHWRRAALSVLRIDNAPITCTSLGMS